MDVVTLIAKLVESLAWPLVFLVIMVLLRRPLTELLPLLKKLKYGDLELQFADKIKTLKAEVDKGLTQMPKDLDPTTEFLLRFTRMARVDPKNTIIEASKYIDNVLLETAEQMNVAMPRVKGIFEGMSALSALEEKGLIDKHVSGLFERLLEIRTLKFGEAESDTDLALDFVHTAANLLAYVRSIKSEL